MIINGRFKVIMVMVLWLCTAVLSAKEVIKVGVVTPLSGDFAMLKEIADVIRLRAVELNQESSNRFEYQYVFEDSKFDPKVSHMAATKLLGTDKVDVLVSIASLSGKVAVPLVERYKVPHIILGGENLAAGQWNFTYFTTAKDMMELLCKTAKALGYKSYVIMGQRQEAGLIAVRSMKAAAQKYGLQERAVLLWNPTDTKDFRTYLLKAREAKADFVIFFPTPPDPDILMKQRKELGIETPFVGIESFELLENKALVNGCWLSGCPLLTADAKAMFQKLGIEPRLTYDYYVYDIPSIIRTAAENAGITGKKPTGDQIRKALSDIRVVENSCMGRVTSDDEGIFHPAPALLYYDNGVGRSVTLSELIKIKGN